MLVPRLFNICVEDCRCLGCFENFPHLSETDPISMVSWKWLKTSPKFTDSTSAPWNKQSLLKNQESKPMTENSFLAPTPQQNYFQSPGSGGGILLSTSPAHFSLTSLTRSSASSVSAQPTAPPNLHKLGGDETISSGDDGGRKKKWHLGQWKREALSSWQPDIVVIKTRLFWLSSGDIIDFVSVRLFCKHFHYIWNLVWVHGRK